MKGSGAQIVSLHSLLNRWWAAGLPLLILPSLLGQSAKPSAAVAYHVILDCTCEDAVDRAYSRALRDIVAKSPRYSEVEDTKANHENVIRLSIVSIQADGNDQNTNQIAAFSVVYAVGTTLLDQKVQTCGKAKAEACAQTIFDDSIALSLN